MTEFSPMVVAVIERFAADMGIDAAAAADGSYSFVFSHWGTVSLTNSEGGEHVLLSLARAPSTVGAAWERRLLDAAGLDARTGEFIHVGLASDGDAVCVARIDQRQFDLPRLDAALTSLATALDGVG